MAADYFLENRNNLCREIAERLAAQVPERLVQVPERSGGLSGTAVAFHLAALFRKCGRSMIVVVPTEKEAENIFLDLKNTAADLPLGLFSDIGILPYEDISPPGRIIYERVECLYRLVSGLPALIICSTRGFCRRIIGRNDFKNSVIELKNGMHTDFSGVISRLEFLGYTRVSKVLNYGEYSVRGGIIDIFSSSSEYPVRIDFFDDEIDNMRLFDTSSQVSFEQVETFHILPKKEVWLDRVRADQAITRLEEVGEFDVKAVEDFSDKLELSLSFNGIEQYISFFYTELGILTDYASDDVALSVVRPEDCAHQYEIMLREYDRVYKSESKKKKVRARPEELFASFTGLKDRLKYVLHPLKGRGGETEVDYQLSDAVNYKGNINDFKEKIRQELKEGFLVVLSASHLGQVKRLAELLRELGPAVISEENSNVIDFGDYRGRFLVVQANLWQGFSSAESSMRLVCDYELFGRSKKVHKSYGSDKSRIIESYIDLKEGDYVVHINHGIGYYRGLKRLTTGGKEKDYLEIEYAGSSKLYVPVEQVNLIQKYIGGKGSAVSIDALGGKAWDKLKKRVKKSVEDIAKKLIELYAVRRNRSKAPFSPDAYYQSDFETEFEFEETPDQLKAIEEIKNDMESRRPMDRLVCGDVGFGKTEVAMRAVFKAVMNSRQCAVLVPTTILSEQHYHNFIHRFRNYPVNIEVLNRFRSARQQKSIIARMAEGKLDVLIGTHRLLGKDIVYKDLGLLVIDEEQKFGVKQKEKIREKARMVDTLTLSATPIPRTLHMSLIKIRDISMINTPPLDRHPVQTFVMEFNEDIIIEAVRKEIERGGQVYFVHNRVESIAQMAVYLRGIIPEIRLCVGHGQMEERDLEEVMNDFINHKYDMLLCTTIIDSGLDIPNVNTIFINNSDHFGLSQLYQLRGRVGRSTRQAYAYMFYKRDRALTEDAMKRLHSISEYISLGSGFKIAMKDLEIRGAGNVLGAEQSGDIMAVGFDMYCQLLDEAINGLKGGKGHEEKIITNLDIKYHGYISDDYIPDNKEKIEIYKKIAAVHKKEDFEHLQNEITDRFGPMPEIIRKLFALSEIRIQASALKVIAVFEKVNRIELALGPESRIDGTKCLNLVSEFPGLYAFNPARKDSLAIIIKNQEKHEQDNTSFDEKLAMISKLLDHIKK